MKRKLLFAMLCIVSVLGLRAQLTDGTVYWIQDTGTGQFLSQGDNWSTRAVAQDVGGLGFEAVYVSDGVYKLNNIMWNTLRNSSVGLGVDVYVDQDPVAWTLTASGDGYLISNDGNYLVNSSNENDYKEKPINKTTDAAAATVWKFLTKAEYDLAIQAYKDAKAAAYAANLGYNVSTVAALEQILATDYIGKDYTSSITNPTIGSNWDGWTHGAISQRNEGAGVGNGCAEFWNGCGYATQTVSNFPNGLYKVEFVGTYRPESNTNSEKVVSEKTSSPAFVYANDAKIEFLHWIDVPAKANSRSGVTKANGYGHSFYAYVADGTLALGVVADGYTGNDKNPYCWNPFGQFTLTYYSDQVAEEDIAVLIATMPSEGTVPTVVYSNLTSLKSTLETDKTIAAYNNLTAAIADAATTVAPYAAYNVAAQDAAIAGVASATISEQNTAVEEATTVDGINACTTALRTAIAAVTSFDITTFTIKNPTAQTKENWEGTDFGDASNNVCEYWNKSGADFHQTVANLPAGNYRLTVVALQRADRTGTVYAGEKRTVIAQTGTVNDRAGASTWFAEGNGVNTVYFTLADVADVTIGLTADAKTSDYWTVWQSFKLETFTETAAATYMKPGYEEAMAAVVAYQTVDMFDADKDALNNAITANTVEEATATIAAYETAIANLNAAATAAATAVANYTRYNEIVTAIGENTNVDLTSFVTNGDFQLNNLNGWTSVDGGNVANNGNFNATYFVERWKSGVALESGSLTHDAIVLPAGVYHITADAQNIEQYNSNAGGTGLFLCANAEQTEIGAKGNYDVYVKVADKEALTIKFLLDDCTGNWVAYDNVTLTYVAADYAYTAVDGKMNATVATTQAAAVEAFEAAQTAANYKALVAAIAAAQVSKDAYTAAAAALTKANSILNSTNVYTAEARTAYAEAIAAAQASYDDNSMTTEVANGLNAALNSADWGAAQTLGAAYIGSAWTGDNIAYNFWSVEGDPEGASGMSTPFIQAWVADAEKLADNNITATLSGLENGLYSVTAFMRAFNNKEGDDAGYDGISFAVNEGTPVAFADATQYTDGYAKEITAEGLVKDGNLVIKVAIEGTNASWLAFKNVNYTKVRDLTPEEMAVVPTAIALYNGEEEVTEPIALNKNEMTVTLTPSYTPANATEGYINWESSDVSVATVSSLGEVTAVLPGTAIITATSTLDNTVSASATVTVTFPESEVSATTYVNDGATRTVLTLGENLIKNGSFEYPNAYYGWTSGTGSTTAITSAKFDIITEGAANGDQYLKAKTNEGGAEAGSLNTSWAIEPGKTYVFGYKVRSTAASTGNQYIGTSLNTTKGQENANAKMANPAYAANEWTDVQYAFESGENTWLVFNARWLANNLSFDNFYLCEAAYTLEGNVDYATAAIPTANIGTGAFQYSQDAIDAANALVQGEATVDDVENAYAAVTTLNAPADGEVFNVMITTNDNYGFKDNPLSFNADNASGAFFPQNTGIKAYRAQQIIFTKVEGNKYKLSTIDALGQEVFIGTNKTINDSGNTGQIRLTTDASKALAMQVVPTSEGVYNLLNTESSNNKLGCQDNPAEKTTGGLYTTNSHSDFTITTATKPSVNVAISADVKYGTRIFPFAPEKISGVKYYSCEAVSGNKLTLTEIEGNLAANTPYILENTTESDINENISGFGCAIKDTYTAGLLTGVYEATPITAEFDGKYVLQKQGNIVGFYQIDTTADPSVTNQNIGANRAYLTAPAAGVKAFFLGGTETAIQGVKSESENGAIYNMAGQRVSRAQKGIFIQNGRKMIVK